MVADTHDALAHCGRDKLLGALREHFWWPAMYSDVAQCTRTCATCQKDKPAKKPVEDLRWIDKGSKPLQGWSIDAAGPFPADADGNRYLLVAVDPFSKWVEAAAVPSLHSWRAAHFLYEQVMSRWGKPRYVRTDNGKEFHGSFSRLCKGLGIVHHRITVGNSKANGQVERTIRTIKDGLRRGLTRHATSYWSDHLPAVLLMLRHTASRMTRTPPVTLLTGLSAALPSLTREPLPDLPAEPSEAEEQAYWDALDAQVQRLHRLGG